MNLLRVFYISWVGIHCLAVEAAVSMQFSQPASILIQGGKILDGSAGSVRQGDVYVRDGRIEKVGDLGAIEADTTIDASGLFVIPGFIDLHSHAEAGLSDPGLASALNNITQGITTVVVGQDGRHPWPVGSSLSSQVSVWQRHGPGNNIVPLVGQGSVRLEVMGWSSDSATATQLEKADAKVREYLAQGAWGISTGLSYSPGIFSSTEEVIVSVRPVREADGFYISHLRNQSAYLLEALDELVEIAKISGVRAVATHIKCAGPRNWGGAGAAVERLKRARASGLSVYADVYPYTTSSDGIHMMPRSLQELTLDLKEPEWQSLVNLPMEELLRTAYQLNPALNSLYTKEFLLRQPASTIQFSLINSVRSQVSYQHRSRQRLQLVLEDPDQHKDVMKRLAQEIRLAGGGEYFEIARHPDPGLLGMTVSEIAQRKGFSEAQTALELVLEGALFTQFHMSEKDVASFIKQPFIAACTDGRIPKYGKGKIHPRSYGAFARRLYRYVKTLGVVDLALAIHTGTGLSAEIIGLRDRGFIRAGQWADIVIFDADRIQDKATFSDPHQYSEGIEWVLINGEVVLERGKPNGNRAGKVLLKAKTL